MDCNVTPDAPECSDNGDGGIIDSIVAFFDDVFGALGKIIDALASLPSVIINGIIDGVKGFIDFLGGLLQSLIDLVAGIVDKIKEVLLWLFVPSDDFWSEQYNQYKTIFDRKMGIGSFERILSSLGNVDSAQMPDFEITVGGVTGKFVDLSNLPKALSFLHMVLRGVTLWYLVNYCIGNVYKLIRKDDI